MANFDKIIDKIIENEGGYVNDPQDKGGETKYGISKRAYPSLNIKKLSLAGAKAIYKGDYWDKIKGDDILSEIIAYELFDTAVNMGVRTASKITQVVCETHPDGFMGENTLKALNGVDEELFVAKFKLAKIARYAYIAKQNPANKKFLFGWIMRTLGAKK